ncbi:MAG: anti-sigma factor [Burkholderiales bacterium]|nr:anti-sigma factor [Burkholderiales bacterium]
MDYSRPERADRLAGEYVLGTLRGPARRRFEELLPAHPALRRAVVRWQDDLMPMAVAVAPVQPAAATWRGIEQRLFGRAERWWQRLAVWRGATAASVAAAAASLVLLLTLAPAPPRPGEAPLLVVMSPNLNATATQALLQKARFVASVSADGRALVLRPLDALPLEASRALELWSVPAKGAPRSLGLVAADRATRLLRARPLEDTAAFAVSVEPAGGSPTGAPTGPIIALGKLDS